MSKLLIAVKRLDGSVIVEAEVYRDWAPLNFEIISAILPAKARAYTLDSYAVYFTLGVRVLLEDLYISAKEGDLIVIPYTNSIAVVLNDVEKLRFKATRVGSVTEKAESLRSIRKGEPVIVDKITRSRTQVHAL
ncbi:MAG: hypothetical protein RMI04_02385 [Thermofilaceae archaeon]|nr:hypothetical protein [Thermofilaceae archaeon]